MAKSDVAKDDAKDETLIEAVAIGLKMQLPADVLERHAVGKWRSAKYGGESVDANGQRWAHVSFPLGPNAHAARSDRVLAVAIIRQPDGYSVARLELPLAEAAKYAVESSDPEGKGFAVDQAQRRIAEAAERA